MAESPDTHRADKAPAESSSFNTFFENWLHEQNSFLEQLITAANNHNKIKSESESEITETENEAVLVELIKQVMQHYKEYYKEKSKWEKRDAIAMYTPSWRSELEDAFLWIGGWRPTLAIHLLYSKSGIQLEAKLGDLLRGLTTGDLGDLTPNQMHRINELQQKTVHEERVLTEKLAQLQETIADRTMVELSSAVSEMLRSGGCGGGDEERVEETLELKNDEMEELLHMADDLRMETLKAVIEVLSPIQAVYFLIAAAELHLRLHEWGKKRYQRG